MEEKKTEVFVVDGCGTYYGDMRDLWMVLVPSDKLVGVEDDYSDDIESVVTDVDNQVDGVCMADIINFYIQNNPDWKKRGHNIKEITNV